MRATHRQTLQGGLQPQGVETTEQELEPRQRQWTPLNSTPLGVDSFLVGIAAAIWPAPAGHFQGEQDGASREFYVGPGSCQPREIASSRPALYSAGVRGH